MMMRLVFIDTAPTWMYLPQQFVPTTIIYIQTEHRRTLLERMSDCYLVGVSGN